ncbi:MAG TPA: triose-phosphate isomerase [Candidatus Cybelea sp.]|nr:triose-phosphate isomerase [Candidatus Cybelea sp.]
MAAARRRLIAGNWKMNGLVRPGLAELAKLAKSARKPARIAPEILICPPATLLQGFRDALREAGAARRIALGGQDCHSAPSGAHTGDLSAEMLKDAGATYVIVGHSERRANHREDNATVREKAAAAHRAGLVSILCVGETLAERDGGRALVTVETQLRASLPSGVNARNTVVAYEPVWAIGTGRTPTPEDVAAVHGHIRKLLRGALPDAQAVRIIYGGSVKADNAAGLLAIVDVDGALVGGASLTAAEFWPIVQAAL